jgi:hypothetical protein
MFLIATKAVTIILPISKILIAAILIGIASVGLLEV